MFSVRYTYNTIENYNDIDIGRVRLRKSPIQGPATEEAAQQAAPQVTINYNVQYHGGVDEDKLADYHRRHIDQMRRDLAEAVYMNNRSSFDGAAAV